MAHIVSITDMLIVKSNLGMLDNPVSFRFSSGESLYINYKGESIGNQ